ncbi:TetR/AcrR family transcriptional regulator [Pontibacillus yanchengensis]|uniref:TetR family transcriptional regulator n=1 Tax=Pontibacillus yanchengensis Y32 TaxID=1385514 RepID=A0A0A2TFN5_9BACI|nr:TetR/AcrR family transcriptional regulator [Pontibacillus yanchengensis]KGP73253.1 TetR family transcriptional regulator [Pontibacillus yanchengensis Y32]
MSPKVSKQHKEQRRANILEAAKDVFIEHGYEKATMKHILEAANVSRGGLYQYFKNKEDVYEALLEESINESMHHTLDQLDEEVSSYWDLLLTRIFGKGQQPDDEMDPMAPSNLEFFITGRNDQRRREYGKTRYYTGLKIYKSIIEKGQENGEFSKKFDSDILARSIISFIDGLALDYSILPPEDVKLKEQSIMFVDYLKMALGVDQG